MITKTIFTFLSSFVVFYVNVYTVNPEKINTLYSSLDTQSISQHLAFYQLYGNTQEGEKALKHAWILLKSESASLCKPFPDVPLNNIVNGIITLVTKESGKPLPYLTESELHCIERLGATLSNRKLKGYYATCEEDILRLSPEEIDLAKGVLFTQLNGQKEAIKQIRTYSALLDLMALQIQAKLPENPTPLQKIRAINDYIFVEMGFRFPPHSLYAKEVDLYTFLPSVLDGRQGVCLGVSILYLCLAQRLELHLEAVTPPGHIYLRYRDKKSEINIETTARGVHIDSEEYLNVSTYKLQQRNIKEIIGMTHFNHASTHLSQGRFEEALNAYKKALIFMPEDSLLLELLAYQYIIIGQKEQGLSLLRKINDQGTEYSISKDSLAEDLLQDKVDAEGIKAYLMSVDESRQSILLKQKALEKVIAHYPEFRMGLSSLAITWLQLHRHHEALEVLEQYWKLDSSDPTIAYYLVMLYIDRFDYNKAQLMLEQLKKLTNAKNHHPKMIREIERTLAILNPIITADERR